MFIHQNIISFDRNTRLLQGICRELKITMADVQPNNNAPAGGQPPNTGRIAANPLITVQDRLFHTLFFRITLAYARGCPKPLRRIIEMMILVKVVYSLCTKNDFSRYNFMYQVIPEKINNGCLFQS